jgi:hypothetical protein
MTGQLSPALQRGTHDDARRVVAMLDALRVSVTVVGDHLGYQETDPSLWCTALVYLAGEIAAQADDDGRGQFIEHLQGLLFTAAHREARQ